MLEHVAWARNLPSCDPVDCCKRILIALDLSADSPALFTHGLCIARKTGAKLFLVHVDDAALVNTLGFLPAETYEQWVTGCQDNVRQQLQPLVEQAREAGVEAEIVPLTGSYGGAILDTAREQNIDLIVMGYHHDRSKVARFIMGSTAVSVLKGAPCPTLMVPLVVGEGMKPDSSAATKQNNSATGQKRARF
ncbi:MAG: universal stress protein [Verrucomicrobiota bacterium]|jgi:nucleotide-binding universal stress UspA family protein